MGWIDDYLQGDEHGALCDACSEATKDDGVRLLRFDLAKVKRDIPRGNIQRLPPICVSMPSEHQDEVAKGRADDCKNDEELVSPRTLDEEPR